MNKIQDSLNDLKKLMSALFDNNNILGEKVRKLVQNIKSLQENINSLQEHRFKNFFGKAQLDIGLKKIE